MRFSQKIQEKTEGLTPDAAEEVLNSILSEQRALKTLMMMEAKQCLTTTMMMRFRW